MSSEWPSSNEVNGQTGPLFTKLRLLAGQPLDPQDFHCLVAVVGMLDHAERSLTPF
jgi:hypothetical protein